LLEVSEVVFECNNADLKKLEIYIPLLLRTLKSIRDMKESENYPNIKFCFINTENMFMNILIQDTSQTINNMMTEYNHIPVKRD
jgi:hypothetical protein